MAHDSTVVSLSGRTLLHTFHGTCAGYETLWSGREDRGRRETYLRLTDIRRGDSQALCPTYRCLVTPTLSWLDLHPGDSVTFQANVMSYALGYEGHGAGDYALETTVGIRQYRLGYPVSLHRITR